jgi:4'-phosphopantetheinyl transferase
MPGERGVGQSPARLQPLGAADVALSITALDEIALAPALKLLSVAELDRAQRITCEEYRLHVVKARALLRLMLAKLTGASPDSFEFDEGVGRQPRLRVNPWGLHFSVSHSGDQVAIAVASAPVGIDIERVEADCGWQAIADTCFHRSEKAFLEPMRGPAACEAFFEIWTRKEAYLKAIGTALETDPPSFSTVGPDSTVVANASGSQAGAWFVRAVDAPVEYKATLVSRWQQPRLIDCQIGGALAGRERPRRRALAGADAASAHAYAG